MKILNQSISPNDDLNQSNLTFNEEVSLKSSMVNFHLS